MSTAFGYTMEQNFKEFNLAVIVAL